MNNNTTNSQLIRKKILVEDLQLGMYVTELDRPWLESPFLFQGFFLTTEEHIRYVKDVCEYVYLDTTRVQEKNTTQKEQTHENIIYPSPPPKTVQFDEEINNADQTFNRTSKLIKSYLKNIDVNHQIDIEEAKEAVKSVVSSVIRTPDALMWLTQLKAKDEYTSQHSMNVCILSVAFGRFIGLAEDELNDLGLCGMLHDMGKMLIPDEVLNKPGKLVCKEIEVMKQHSFLGMKILKRSKGNVPLSVINVAYSHHERLDGKGYPRGLSNEQLTLATRIVAIADMYDALTSDRVYRNGRSHLEAINILTKMTDSHLDYALVLKFIECLSIYPPGCIVKLNTDEIAIVVEINQDEKLRPRVLLLLGADKQPRKEKLIDLSEREKDGNGEVYIIRHTVRARDYGIDIMKFYHSGVLQKGFSSL